MVKNLLATQETQVRFLGGEDPLAEDMATHSSILAWSIPWTEEPGGLQSLGSKRLSEVHFDFFSLSFIQVHKSRFLDRAGTRIQIS